MRGNTAGLWFPRVVSAHLVAAHASKSPQCYSREHVDGQSLAGRPVRVARPLQSAWIHPRGDQRTGAGHRREHRHFSVVNSIMLRPLPFPEAQPLMDIYHVYPGLGTQPRFGLAHSARLRSKEPEVV
jgi:hypothetical protein